MNPTARGWIEGASVRVSLSKMNNNPALPPSSLGMGSDMEPELTINDEFYDQHMTAVAGFPGADTFQGRIVREVGSLQGFSPIVTYPGPPLASDLSVPGVIEAPGLEACRWDVDISHQGDDVDAFAGVCLVLSSASNTALAAQFFGPTNPTAPPGYAVVGATLFVPDGWRVQSRSILGGARLEDFTIASPPMLTGAVFSRVSFRVLRGAPAVGTFGVARNQQFRCLVNGVQVFAEDLGEANAPQVGGNNRAWRFVAASGIGNDPFLLDNCVGWFGDSRVYYGS